MTKKEQMAVTSGVNRAGRLGFLDRVIVGVFVAALFVIGLACAVAVGLFVAGAVGLFVASS